MRCIGYKALNGLILLNHMTRVYNPRRRGYVLEKQTMPFLSLQKSF